MGASGEDFLVGLICAVITLLLAWRTWAGVRSGEMALYRERLRKADIGATKFAALIAIRLLLMLLTATIAADLLLGLGLRGH